MRYKSWKESCVFAVYQSHTEYINKIVAEKTFKAWSEGEDCIWNGFPRKESDRNAISHCLIVRKQFCFCSDHYTIQFFEELFGGSWSVFAHNGEYYTENISSQLLRALTAVTIFHFRLLAALLPLTQNFSLFSLYDCKYLRGENWSTCDCGFHKTFPRKCMNSAQNSIFFYY